MNVRRGGQPNLPTFIEKSDWPVYKKKTKIKNVFGILASWTQHVLPVWNATGAESKGHLSPDYEVVQVRGGEAAGEEGSGLTRFRGKKTKKHFYRLPVTFDPL